MTRDYLSIWLAFFSFLLLTCCGTGRRAQPIDVPSDALAVAAQEAGTDPLFSSCDALPEDWWTLFDDAQLADFIEMALVRNPTLQMARAKILAAAYTADQARAALFPNLSWGGDASRQKLSETGIIPFSTPAPIKQPAPIVATGGKAGVPVYFTQYETELFLTYDFDIWGKNRNMWRAAVGEERARQADEAFARLQLGISIAQVYYNLQIAYQRQAIAQSLVDNQAQLEGLTQQRLQGNLDTQQVLFSARATVYSFQQGLLQIQGQIAVYENQLRAYLAGSFDEGIAPVEERPLPRIPLPSDLPLHLLSQRPDIAAQLWVIASAGRQIEAAKAGFYPDFNLASLVGYQTIHLKKLFTYPSVMFNVDPAFTLPIFDGWRLLANLRGSEINYDLAILQYNEMVLNAVKEVLDGIVVLRNSEQQLQVLHQQVQEQEGIYQNAQLRVAHHLDSALDELLSEQNVLQARDREIVALGNKIQAMLQLIQALGGGYREC